MVDTSILSAANIPQALWPYCTLDNGIIKTPNTGVLYQNGLATEVEYQAWQEAQQIDICSEKTTEEKLAELINQVDSMDAIIAELLIEM